MAGRHQLILRETVPEGNLVNEYRVIANIGSFHEGQFPIFHATMTREVSQVTEEYNFAVKRLNSEHFPAECQELAAAVARSNSVAVGGDRALIMRIHSSFNCDGHLCVAFQYMSLGSIRHIMRMNFEHNGMPEYWILVVLRETLRALATLHQNHLVHDQLHAGNVLVTEFPPHIRVSFAATIYSSADDENEDMYDDGDFLLARDICTWGSAPEKQQNGGDEAQAAGSYKSDIWMVGIMAVELACGGLRVKNRRALERVAKKIGRKGRIPWVSDRANLKDKVRDKFTKLVSRLQQSVGMDDSVAPPVATARAYSDGFHEMVARCLQWDAEARPTAEELLGMRVMTELTRTPAEFYRYINN